MGKAISTPAGVPSSFAKELSPPIGPHCISYIGRLAGGSGSLHTTLNESHHSTQTAYVAPSDIRTKIGCGAIFDFGVAPFYFNPSPSGLCTSLVSVPL